MKQVVVIHGGSTFDTYDEYLSALKEKIIDIEYLETKKGWKSALADELGAGYNVLTLQMPNKQNAKYKEWKIWFEKILPLLDKRLILIGHSLGGIFLAKYLSENTINERVVAGCFLVAAPYDMQDRKGTLGDFTLTDSFEKIHEQSRYTHLYHSTDDPVVPFVDLAKYQRQLPYARATVFNDRQHFNQENFPELVEDIRALG